MSCRDCLFQHHLEVRHEILSISRVIAAVPECCNASINQKLLRSMVIELMLAFLSRTGMSTSRTSAADIAFIEVPQLADVLNIRAHSVFQ